MTAIMTTYNSPGILSRRVTLRRRIGWTSLAISMAGAALAIGLPAFGVKGPGLGWAGLVSLLGLAVGPQLLVSGSQWVLGRKGRPGTFSLEEGRVTITSRGGRRLVEASEVEGGWREQQGADHFAQLRLLNGELLTIRTTDANVAARLLTTLGVTERRAVALAVPRAGSVGRRLAGCAAPLVLLMLLGLIVSFGVQVGRGATLPGPFGSLALAGVLGLLTLHWAVGALAGTRVVVGTDGVVIDRPLRSPRFVAYGELRAVSVLGPKPWGRSPARRSAVRFERLDGSTIDVRTAGPDDAVMLRDRVRAAMTVVTADGEVPFDPSRLDRRARDLPTWRAALEVLARQQPTYREHACGLEHLAALCESPRERPERRAAAAVALAASGDESLRPRLRIAAEGCAHPKLRDALEAAEAGDEIDEAVLEELSRETARS